MQVPRRVFIGASQDIFTTCTAGRLQVQGAYLCSGCHDIKLIQYILPLHEVERKHMLVLLSGLIFVLLAAVSGELAQRSISHMLLMSELLDSHSRTVPAASKDGDISQKRQIVSCGIRGCDSKHWSLLSKQKSRLRRSRGMVEVPNTIIR